MVKALTKFHAQNDPPVAPENLMVTPNSSTSLAVNWDSDEVEEHEVCIERCTDNENFVETQRVSGDTNGVVEGSLVTDTTYYYRLRTVLRGVYSRYSDIAFSTPAEGGGR